MVSLEVYKITHLIGILMVFLSYGGLVLRGISGNQEEQAGTGVATATHGVGMFLILVAGFGMLARLNIHWPWPGWVMTKVAIWIILGGLIMLARRGKIAHLLWWLLLAFGGFAAYLAGLKPY